MKTEKQIKEQIEKYEKRILSNEKYLENANGKDITLSNRIHLQQETETLKRCKSSLEWVFSRDFTKEEIAPFLMP